MIDKLMFKKVFAKALQNEGFCKKGSTWYLDGAEVTVVLNLQHSDHGEYFYINVGFWLKSLGDNSFPKENHCHVRLRLPSIFVSAQFLIEKVCSLEYGTTEDLDQFVNFFEKEAIPFLRSICTEEQLARKIDSGLFKHALMLKIAKEKLEAV